MNKVARSALMVLFAVFVTFTSFAQAMPKEVVLVNDPYPPFVMAENNPLGPGIDVEIATLALQKLGITTRVVLVPFSRGLLMLENGEAHLTTTLSVREDRD